MRQYLPCSSWSFCCCSRCWRSQRELTLSSLACRSTPCRPARTRTTSPRPSDGGIWYTAQRTGELGWLDPETGEIREVALGSGSAPHGVIVGPDGAPWITDGGLNAIVRVDPATSEVQTFPLPGRAAPT